ncbi:DeoR family transcriptional regulator of aga operon [Ereboglobus sp. PH5-5]|uniref:DeoR/GlpR family DNA-binding transcription regulator n=1 Tax=Ereboglobus sp. PH5-5 TaxID=2940529 RepID=UPI002404D4BB|nr:DeoR/GlpR family DNA-binding transcription regulator [Ereboglobus sp. PH5-5]MDF9833948.1 DeoR family transcriptional regulator of aga operon [Ereboglobus sp. PH5-5]
MLSIAERHKYILDLLNTHGFVRVTDLAERLGMTKVTIRNDLKMLEGKGMLYRMHGSASKANPHVSDVNVKVKGQLNSEKKRLIGLEAARHILEDDSVIIGSGSTVEAFAAVLKPVRHLNVVTLSLRVSMLLCEQENIDVLQLGGNVNHNSLSVRGDYSASGLANLVCSKLFIGVDGLDLEYGVTASTVEEATLTQKMMQVASQVVVLADSSKFGKRGFGRIGSLEDIDMLVTDDGIPEHFKTALEDAGVDVRVVAGERPFA